MDLETPEIATDNAVEREVFIKWYYDWAETDFAVDSGTLCVYNGEYAQLPAHDAAHISDGIRFGFINVYGQYAETKRIVKNPNCDMLAKSNFVCVQLCPSALLLKMGKYLSEEVLHDHCLCMEENNWTFSQLLQSISA